MFSISEYDDMNYEDDSPIDIGGGIRIQFLLFFNS